MENCVSGHGVYRTEYNIVWIPKYCRRILNPGMRGYMRTLFPMVMCGLPGCEIVELNMQVDHIHMIMVIPPKYGVSAVVGRVKQYTTSGLREKFSWLEKVYWNESVVWSLGYFVSMVGLNENQILAYVRWQTPQDSGQSKLELF